MPQNFIECGRDQCFLMPPSLREWLDPGHLAWLVIEAVEEFDLGAFYRAYRVDGHGRAAHDPAMMVALLSYAYAVGERSARRIESRCREDVAFRVIAANASGQRNRTYEQVAREVLEEAAEVDAREDELYGSARGGRAPSGASRFPRSPGVAEADRARARGRASRAGRVGGHAERSPRTAGGRQKAGRAAGLENARAAP